MMINATAVASWGRTTHEWCRSNPRIADAVFAGVLVVLSIFGLTNGKVEGSEQAPDLLAYVLLIGGSVSLAWRRTSPIAVLAVVVCTTIPFWVLDYATAFDALVLVALYATTAHTTDRRRAWVAAGSAIAILTIVTIIGVVADREDLTVNNAINVVVFLSIGAVFGDVVRNRRNSFAEMERRAIEAEADRAAEAQRAVAVERVRIAREMHDVVAHGMSVIVVQAAGAQRVVRTNPDLAVDALKSIETTGRESLSEMRRMLGVLREKDGDEGDLIPQPTLADVPGFVAHCVDAGIPTELVVRGDQRDLGPGLELAAFRVVQEALTNVLKHGGQSAEAVVELTYADKALTVVVTDDGRGAAGSLGSDVGGHGLIGLRERVEIYKGEFSAGPKPGGGFRVSAVVPFDEPQWSGAAASSSFTRTEAFVAGETE